MGYPMTYKRLILRNHLEGDYDRGHVCQSCGQYVHPKPDPKEEALAAIRGDLRRLEADQQDVTHLDRYALRVGALPATVKALLTAFSKETSENACPYRADV